MSTQESTFTKKASTRSTVLILLAIVVIFAVALGIGLSNGDFGGADGAATEVIESSAADYEPWYEPFWSQPGGEVESGLFALQSALGAGLIGFVFGTLRERHQARKTAQNS